MSHLGKYGTKITNARKNICIRALELTIKQLKELEGMNIKQVENHKNRYGVIVNKQNANIGVILDEDTNGSMGVNVTSRGELEFVGDRMGAYQLYKKGQNLFVQNYQTIAVKMALSRMGYKTKVSHSKNRKGERIALVEGVN